MYINQKKTIKEIARDHGVSENTVIYWLKKYGIRRYKHRRPPNKGAIDKETLIELYCKEQLSTIDIAKILECSQTKVQYYMKKYGIKSRNTFEHKTPVWNKQFAKYKYRGITLPYEDEFIEYLKSCGLSYTTINTIVRTARSLYRWGWLTKDKETFEDIIWHTTKKYTYRYTLRYAYYSYHEFLEKTSRSLEDIKPPDTIFIYERKFTKYLIHSGYKYSSAKLFLNLVRTLYNKGWLFLDSQTFEDVLWAKVRNRDYIAKLKQAYAIFHEFLKKNQTAEVFE